MTADSPSRAAESSEDQQRAGRREVLRYALRRFGVYLFTLWAAITVAFFIFRLVPGDPMNILLGNLTRAEGRQRDAAAEEAIIARYRHIFGMDEPLPLQYVNYLRKAVLGGLDLGPSFVEYPAQTKDLVFRRMPWTLGIFTTSVLLAWLVGTGLGALIGWLQRSRLSKLAVVLSTLLQITPVYLVALGLIIYVGYTWRLLPAGGPYARHLQPEWSWEFISSLLTHAILPMLSNMIVIGAGFTLGMRALMISVLGEDYLVFARAKGLSPFTVLKDYAFRNALIPQVTALAIIVGATLNGTFIIEVLFQLPGLGTLFVQAMGLRDFNTMQAVVLFSIFAVLTLTMIVDLALPLLDPRIRRTA